MKYWYRAKMLPAEARALEELDAKCLNDIGVVLEPTMTDRRTDDPMRNFTNAVEGTIQAFSKFRPPALDLKVPHPHSKFIDCAPLAARAKVNSHQLTIEVLRRLSEAEHSVGAVISPENSIITDAEKISEIADGLMLKLRRRNLENDDYAGILKSFFEKFSGLLPVSVIIDLEQLSSKTTGDRVRLLQTVLPRVTGEFGWKHVIIGVYGCPKFDELPIAGAVAELTRSEIVLAKRIRDNFPDSNIELCDRALVPEGFFPRKENESRPKKPLHLALTGADKYFMERDAVRDSCASSYRRLAEHILRRHEDKFHSGRPLKEWKRVANGYRELSSAGARLALQLAQHLDSSVYALRRY